MNKVWIHRPVRESTPADPDALQDTIASELVHHKGRVEQAGGLVVVGDDTADEVGVSLVQGGQQGIELCSERRRDSLEGLWSGVFSLLFLLSFVWVLLWL